MYKRSMYKLMSCVTAVLICAAFAPADSSSAAAAGRGAGFGLGAGGVHAFHGGLHGFRGFYGGLYPYSLFGYPNYSYGGYYPYSAYEDDSPNCDFVWVNQSVKHKIVRRGIWRCP